MASPGGGEAGRLHIKILPDTDGFRTRLQTVLDQIEEAAKLAIKVTADVSELEEKIALATRDRRVTVDVDGNTDPAERDIDRTTRRRRRMMIDVELRRATAVNRFLREVTRRQQVKVDADTGAAELKIKALTRRRRVNIQARVDRGFLGNVARAMDGVKNMFVGFGKAISGAVRGGMAGVQEGLDLGANGFSKLTQGVTGFIGNIGVMGPLVVAAIGMLIGVLGAAVAMVSVLAGAWIGLIGVMVAPLAPIAAGAALIAFSEKLEKTKEKAVDTFIKIRETFASALSDSNLIPAIEDALLRIGEWAVESKGKLEDFFNAGSKFVDPMIRSFTGFIDNFIDPLTSALDNLAANGFAESMVTGMEDLGTVLGEFFEDLSEHGAAFGEVFEALAPMLDPIVDGFADFAGAMAEIAPDLMVELGHALGRIFTTGADHKDDIEEMAYAFIDMLNAVIDLLPYITQFVTVLAGMTAAFLQANSRALELSEGIIDWATGTALPAVKEFFGFTEEKTEETVTALDDLGSMTSSIASGIAAQISTMANNVATEHEQMKNGVLTDWTTIGEYTDEINNGIGTAAENAQIRVDAAAAAANLSWSTYMEAMKTEGATVFETLELGATSMADNMRLQAERMAAEATTGANTAKDGINGALNGAAENSKSAYDSMSDKSRQTWDEIVQQASKGSTDMNVTSTKAWEGLGQQAAQVLRDINTAISDHSKTATTELGAVPMKGGEEWDKFPGKVESAMSTARDHVETACDAMKTALNSVTSQTWTINVEVNTTKVVSEINRVASEAKAQRMLAPEGPGLYAAYSAVPGAVRAFTDAVTNLRAGKGRGFSSGAGMADALNAPKNYGADAKAQTVQNVTVNANTDANPFDIGREVAWAIRGM
ncbi:hypothetical protein ACN20G_29890 (plasmid) [Streptomyces sp. BI20]|uniref:hypothetical protein n=1 Tax=Streptomyces sp. BI20 TaxID=3403460 RepID=UPI003C762503